MAKFRRRSDPKPTPVKRGKRGPAPYTVDLSIKDDGPCVDLDAPVRGLNPPKPIREIIFNAAAVMGTLKDTATILGYSEVTLLAIMKRQPEVRRLWEDGQAQGRMSLRGNMFKMSSKNAAAGIFLCKNHLGMRDDVGVNGQVDHRHLLVHLLQKFDDGQHGKVIEAVSTEQVSMGKVIEMKKEPAE